MRIVASSGQSSRRRRAICCGLHALASAGPAGDRAAGPSKARLARAPRPRPGRQSCQTTDPAHTPAAPRCPPASDAAPPALHAIARQWPDTPACRCAWLRCAGRTQCVRPREIVEADRPICRAISRMPTPCARRIASPSRSASDRYRPDGGIANRPNIAGGTPPAFRNHLVPTVCGTPAPIAASSLDKPAAIPAQNRRCSCRPATGGRPGDHNDARPAQSEFRFRLTIATSSRVLRQPIEFTLAFLITVMDHVAGAALSDRHFQRIDHHLGTRISGHRPTDNLAAPGVQHHSQIQEPVGGRHEGDIGPLRWPSIGCAAGTFRPATPTAGSAPSL